MKNLIPALCITLAVLAQPALAGPYHSVSIDTLVTPGYTLDVPKGKAVTIVNFIDAVEQQTPAQLLVQLEVPPPNSAPFAPFLTASVGDLNNGVAQKDLTICGPATIKIGASGQHFVHLCYKLFAN